MAALYPLAKTTESQPFSPASSVETKLAAPVIPEPQPVEVKQQLFNFDLLTDRINWSHVSACLSSFSSCVCYGLLFEHQEISSLHAVQNGWAKKRS